MTKKRFRFDGGSNCIDYDGKSILLDSYGEKIEELLNELHEENIKIKSLIDKKIDYLQRKYDFGQEQGFCPMHNIMHSINVLKEIKKEMGWE
jgi:hypothetical protein